MGKNEDWKCIGEKKFSGDIIITDTRYVLKGDWDEDEAWAKEHGLESHTFYGDWGCTVFKTTGTIGNIPRKSEKLGKFCADAGRVCVLHLKDALKKSPDFKKWIEEHKWCVAVIEGFEGTVRLMTKTTIEKFSDGTPYKDTELRIRGEGTIGGEEAVFETVQTSL